MKIVLLDEARRRFEAEDQWWRDNRDSSDLFLEEFERTLQQLSAAPESGQLYRQARRKLIRRVLMQQTRCHIYYFHDRAQDLLEVHAIWGARRGRGPSL